MQEYSDKFKRKMVQRMSGASPTTATALSKEVGIAQGTLSRWLRRASTIDGVKKSKKLIESDARPRRTEERSAEEKFRVVAHAAALSESELGAFLRQEGLHQADLEAWRTSMLAGLSPGSSTSKGARSGEARKVRELESELRRKDKALAEAAALLVLQKKVRALWADEGDDTPKESDE